MALYIVSPETALPNSAFGVKYNLSFVDRSLTVALKHCPVLNSKSTRLIAVFDFSSVKLSLPFSMNYELDCSSTGRQGSVFETM